MQKPTMTDKVKNVLGVGHHGHTHGTHGGVTGTHTGTHPGVVQQVENAVTGHGTHGTGTGYGTGTGLGAGTGLGPAHHHTPGTTTGLGTTGHTTGLGTGYTAHTGVVGQVENALHGHGTHGTHATGTHATGTHATSGPAALLTKAKLKVTGHT